MKYPIIFFIFLSTSVFAQKDWVEFVIKADSLSAINNYKQADSLRQSALKISKTKEDSLTIIHLIKISEVEAELWETQNKDGIYETLEVLVEQISNYTKNPTILAANYSRLKIYHINFYRTKNDKTRAIAEKSQFYVKQNKYRDTLIWLSNLRTLSLVALNTNKLLENEKFTGKFDIEGIEDIFSVLSKTFYFNYKIKNNLITIN